MMNEFDIIKNFFANQTRSRNDVMAGIGDDAAIVDVPDNYQLAITTDTLVAGIHFPIETPPFDIGYKSIAVNLSDLAAMGAMPAWITLALTLPQANETWLTEFSRGLFTLANRFNIQLIGGDLTQGPLSITLQAIGLLPKNKALKRNTAKPGDLIYVTNFLGDAALGLQCLQKKIKIPDENYFISRLNQPEPQIEIGQNLLEIANAAIDISDGLSADLQHILTQSNVGAIINVDQLPLSPQMRKALPTKKAIELALTGGDDYELCFTVPKEKQTQLKNAVTCIGIITEKKELTLHYQNGTSYDGNQAGYQHFS